MKISDIPNRDYHPKPWAEGEKIPWNDPEFSKRMLKEHLSQAHDAASRRFEIIDKHIRWMHEYVLKEKPTRILDLGCGPGFYTNRLARLGHTCVGIDFSPASIAYAKEQADEAKLDIQYFQQDIRTAEYGEGFGLVMSIYGELNVFRKEEAKNILKKANQALVHGGSLLIEPHSFEAVRELGAEPNTWYSVKSGLFSAKPHLGLQENFWDEDEKVAIYRIYVIDAETGKITSHSSSTQAYTVEEYRGLLAECGFSEIEVFPSLGKTGDGPLGYLIAILAQK